MKYKGQNQNYKSAEKGILLTFDPLYIRSENLKIPIVGRKIKVVESICCDLLKLLEGQKGSEKRFSSIGLTSFEKKPKNYLKIPYSGKAAFSGSFWAFSHPYLMYTC